ncbi:hypothetical protein AVEN_120554-1 [Araneus ventricosus]|uniref:Uncharacterized protein n=1 Tax=Araneus ventricosus TaxID=182803 RepID=A0A4Y2HDS6_ARAVE|nr:hypothetical protein AVEN_120554-1 [Araneus ventricosus]
MDVCFDFAKSLSSLATQTSQLYCILARNGCLAQNGVAVATLLDRALCCCEIQCQREECVAELDMDIWNACVCVLQRSKALRRTSESVLLARFAAFALLKCVCSAVIIGNVHNL